MPAVYSHKHVRKQMNEGQNVYLDELRDVRRLQKILNSFIDADWNCNILGGKAQQNLMHQKLRNTAKETLQ